MTLGVRTLTRLGNFNKWLGVAIDGDLYAALRSEALRQGISVAALVRKLLARGLAEEAAAAYPEAVTEIVRRAIEPSENRLNDLIFRVAEAAATAMHLNLLTLERMGAEDVEGLHEEARKKAVCYLSVEEEGDE